MSVVKELVFWYAVFGSISAIYGAIRYRNSNRSWSDKAKSVLAFFLAWPLVVALESERYHGRNT